MLLVRKSNLNLITLTFVGRLRWAAHWRHRLIVTQILTYCQPQSDGKCDKPPCQSRRSQSARAFCQRIFILRIGYVAVAVVRVAQGTLLVVVGRGGLAPSQRPDELAIGLAPVLHLFHE